MVSNRIPTEYDIEIWIAGTHFFTSYTFTTSVYLVDPDLANGRNWVHHIS